MSDRLTVAERIREAFMDGAFTYERSLKNGEVFDRWLAQVKAEAWDEGFNAGEGEAYEHEARLQWSMPHTCAKNPYREETK